MPRKKSKQANVTFRRPSTKRFKKPRKKLTKRGKRTQLTQSVRRPRVLPMLMLPGTKRRKRPNPFHDYDKKVINSSGHSLLMQTLQMPRGDSVFAKFLEQATDGKLSTKLERDAAAVERKKLFSSAENKKLLAERTKYTASQPLSIGPLYVDRTEFSRHYNFNNIPSHPYRTLFTGTTGSGKTNCMISLLVKSQFLRDFFDIIYIFSPNALIEPEFMLIKEANRGEVFYYETFDEREIERIFAEMKETAQRFKSDRSLMPRVLLIIDDFAGVGSAMRNQTLTNIFFMSRKYSCSTWISLQRYKQAPSAIRLNSEFHVLFEQPQNQTKILAEELAVGLFSEKMMLDAMTMVSETPFSFIFINTKLRVRDGRFRFTFTEKLIPATCGREDSCQPNEKPFYIQSEKGLTNIDQMLDPAEKEAMEDLYRQQNELVATPVEPLVF